MIYRNKNMQTTLLTDKEKVLAKHIQGDIPVHKRPFGMIGEAVGLREDEVIDIIGRLKRDGLIRKFVAILRHQKAGYEKNAMVVWAVPESACETTGRLFASFKEITHCYERTPPFEGKYNIFTMIHFRKDKPDELIQKLSLLAGIDDFKVLFSVEEFKKSSMTYF
jgi:siroheme decarboxylase